MSWINDPVNSPKHYTDSHPGMECIDLRGQAEANGLEHEYRIWRDLALGDTDTALANLDILLDHERNQQ